MAEKKGKVPVTTFQKGTDLAREFKGTGSGKKVLTGARSASTTVKAKGGK